MSTEELETAAIRARVNAATPGPWMTLQSGDEESTTWLEHHYGDVLNHDERGYGHQRENYSWMKRPDAEFIAHARTDVPALLDEVDRLRKVIEDAPHERNCLASDWNDWNPCHTCTCWKASAFGEESNNTAVGTNNEEGN